MDGSRRTMKKKRAFASASYRFRLSASFMAILVVMTLSQWHTARRMTHNDITFNPPLYSEYASIEEQNSRSNRFPSVDDRVRIYMGRWYVPPCQESDKVGFKLINNTVRRSGQPEQFFLVRELYQADHPKRQRTFVLTKSVQNTRVFYLDRQELQNCSAERLKNYCSDAREYILPVLDRLSSNSTTSSGVPTLLQYVVLEILFSNVVLSKGR